MFIIFRIFLHLNYKYNKKKQLFLLNYNYLLVRVLILNILLSFQMKMVLKNKYSINGDYHKKMIPFH